MATPEPQDRDRLFLRLFLKSSTDVVTEEEVEYFRDHPDEIEEVFAPVKVHKFFLWIGAILGTSFVGLSKVLKYVGLRSTMSEGASEFLIDIVFEIGVALIGAAVTAYLLGILLNQQQENASRWRREMRRRIMEHEEPERTG